jgi:hypothetical protein
MTLRALAIVCVGLLGVGVAAAQPQPASPGIGDELVSWMTKAFDEAYVKPDANLATYRKVMIDPPQVVFQQGWLKNINYSRDPSRWLRPADQQKIADDMSSGVGRVFADVFKSRGYEVVAAPGPGVLRITPNVADLYLNAPDTPSANLTRTFNVNAADATLVLDARDSVTGATLARFVDRSTVRQARQRLNYATDVSNLFWMEAAARIWATNASKEFEAGPERVRTSSAVAR